MPLIVIHHPGADRSLSVALSPGEACLIGRSPAPTQVAALVGNRRLSCVVIDHEAISGNHCLVWCDVSGVYACDLASRNGTWSRLDASPTLLSGARLRIDLAGVVARTRAAATPIPAPGWRGADDFARSVGDVLQRWFDAQGVSVRVVVTTPDTEALDPRLALATGGVIDVVRPGGATADLRFPALMEDAARFVATQNALIEQESGHDEGFVLRSSPFREAHRRVFDAAARGHRLLLLGPSGVGKERLATCYHRHSDRRSGPFMAVNCALLDRGMVWAQLFGATRGSFTGAVGDVRGAVEAAHGGTLFLDEVAELDATTQSALLRFLDARGEYQRLGDPKARTADVRVVAATNRDLRAAVRVGSFRQDLWYRFAAAVVEVPGLRDRPEDIAAFLIGRSCWDAFTDGAKELLLGYDWPGNFRELDNFAQRIEREALARPIDRAAASVALREGAAAVVTPSEPPPDAPRGGAWEAILARAAVAWREDRGGDPATLGDLDAFNHGYVKPLFAARASGVDQGAPVDGINWSALGRRIAVADGSTVRRWVMRYLDRFRR